MIRFRTTVYDVLLANCNNGYTIKGYKLDPVEKTYGDITLIELGLDETTIVNIKTLLERMIGKSIPNNTARDWIKISDIENTLNNIFT